MVKDCRHFQNNVREHYSIGDGTINIPIVSGPKISLKLVQFYYYQVMPKQIQNGDSNKH